MNPPTTKKPVATRPAKPARTVMTFLIKSSTLLTPAVYANAGSAKNNGSPIATNAAIK